jgi:two-component system nitrate/nitrite response regulator NarL
MPQPVPVRVVVADRFPVFRYGIKRLLDGTDHLRMVGEAEDHAQAVETVRQLEPDVLLLSVESDQATADVLRALGTVRRRVHCILVTDSYAQPPGPPVDSRIRCVLPRTATGRDFLHCIECAMAHQCWPVKHAPSVSAGPVVPVTPKPARRFGLTNREAQIVAAVAEGGTNKDIAGQLAIAEDTVKHHMSNIFDKVGVSTRLELAVFALFHHVVEKTGPTSLSE